MSIGIIPGSPADKKASRRARHAAESMSETQTVEALLAAAQEVLGRFKPAILGFDPLLVRKEPVHGFDDIRRMEIAGARRDIEGVKHQTTGLFIVEAGASVTTYSVANKEGVLVSFSSRSPTPVGTFRREFLKAAKKQKLLKPSAA